MYNISDKQIDYILDDIRRRGIEMEDLQLNLLDHICCIIEQNLSPDGDFEGFYKQTIPKFCKKELWEIEEETILLLTYKNYYTMKKAMILSGNISLALIAIGTVLKIFHWPGAAISLLLGFFILCFIFFPSALYFNYNSSKRGLGVNLTAFLGGTSFMLGILFKVMHWPGASMLLLIGWTILLGAFIPLLLFSKLRENNTPGEKGIYVLGAIAMILFELATLFKVMHWPGAGPLLIVGSFLLVGIFIPMYTNKQIKANQMNPGKFVFVITLTMYTVALTFLLAMNVQGPVLERFAGDTIDNKQIVSYFEKKNQRLENQLQTDSASQLKHYDDVKTQAQKTRQLINALRLELVKGIENVDEAMASNLISNPYLIIRKDNFDIGNQVLLDPSGNKASALKKEIEQFRTVALKYGENNVVLKEKISGLFNTSDDEYLDTQRTWEERTFRNCMLITTLSRLTAIEKNILLAESNLLTLK